MQRKSALPKQDRGPPSPETLEAKFKLLQKLPYDKRAKRKHNLVFGFILDWWHKDYGDAMASVRHVVKLLEERDPSGEGLYMGDVHTALTDLVAWEYLHQEKGSGRRASRYIPNWSLVCSVQKIPNTSLDDHSVRETPNAGVRENLNTTGDSVQEIPNEDPSTETRLPDRVTVDGRMNDCASPSAPLADGLAAPAARAAQGRFEELWFAYGYRRDKKVARAAYDDLKPDADEHAAMVASAVAWQAAWAAQEKPDAPRKRLDTWLLNEDWDCDPPAAFQPKAKKAEPASRRFRITSTESIGTGFSDSAVRLQGIMAGSGEDVQFEAPAIGLTNSLSAALTTELDAWVGALVEIVESAGGPRVQPACDIRTMTVSSARMDFECFEGEEWVELLLTAPDGSTTPRLLCVDAGDAEGVEEEKRELQRLRRAAGLPAGAPSSELVGARIKVTRKVDGSFHYGKAAAGGLRRAA